MEYIYATMLLHSAKKPVDEEHLTKVLHSIGIQAEQAKVKALVASLKEINIDETIKNASAVQVTATVAKEEKHEKKEVEEKHSEEEVSAGLGALFG